MKREIKFRHFDPNYKAMTPFEEIRILPSDKKFCHLFNPDSDGGFLMQYTGLKDKNGTEIYEGDIVKLSGRKRVGEYRSDVIYRRCGFTVSLNNTYLNNDAVLIGCEIIGNIHQNPELLTPPQ